MLMEVFLAAVASSLLWTGLGFPLQNIRLQSEAQSLFRRERDRQLDSLTLPPENGQPDVGLMMKLQSALKEAHREKEVLERRLEDVEGTRSQQESLRLQEVEVGVSLAFILIGKNAKKFLL